jgi:putative exporter of polyketide antibiotics
MAGQTAHFSPLSSVQKALVTYIACILLSSVAPSCGGCVPEMVEIDWRGKRRSPNL